MGLRKEGDLGEYREKGENKDLLNQAGSIKLHKENLEEQTPISTTMEKKLHMVAAGGESVRGGTGKKAGDYCLSIMPMFCNPKDTAERRKKKNSGRQTGNPAAGGRKKKNIRESSKDKQHEFQLMNERYENESAQ